jgi:O-antigen/teichoic acid export membrane protein
MKLERTKNALRNIIWGFLNKFIVIVLPFINRTIMIYLMGDQYVGLGSLFTSILEVLNIAELGIGSALVYNMYKPIADGDSDKICALMNFYRKCYRIIGLIVLTCGLILLPFLQFLIKGSWPSDINIYILYLMYLSQTVLSYNLFAYKNCLLGAHQRTDITSKINMTLNVLKLLLQMFVLICTRNYYLFVGVGIAFGIIMNLSQAYFVDKLFPDYKCHGELDKQTLADLKKKVMGLISSKIGGVVINQADNIVISAFLGLAVLGWYNNYYYIMSSIIGFLDIILVSMTAGI